MRSRLPSSFSLSANGGRLEVDGVQASRRVADDPGEARFDRIERIGDEIAEGIVTKTAAAEVVRGVAGGAGSSLSAEQKRTLHVRAQARLLARSRKQMDIQLLQPIGSSFRFHSEEGADARAPAALDYLSAGIGFCFMTQLGRYAHIKELKLRESRIVQDTGFGAGSADGAPATAEPVDTHVFLAIDEPDEIARQMLFMGERTCFLHAAMRESNPTRVTLAGRDRGPTG